MSDLYEKETPAKTEDGETVMAWCGEYKLLCQVTHAVTGQQLVVFESATGARFACPIFYWTQHYRRKARVIADKSV